MPNETITFSDRLLKKREVAGILSCSTRSVERLVNAGRLSRVRILGGIRFRFSQVQMLMKGGHYDTKS